MNLWHNNWEKFVEEAARCYSDGLRGNQLSEQFAGNKIYWSGEIRSVELGQDLENGIAMDMPEVKIRLVDGNLIVANYIFLNMESSKLNDWQKISPGKLVTFSADIQKARSDYPEVEVSICSKNPEIILKLGTENARPI
ncbi:MAG: hypothetical protein ACRBDX_01250 [Gammaproteobacteria bacterium]